MFDLDVLLKLLVFELRLIEQGFELCITLCDLLVALSEEIYGAVDRLALLDFNRQFLIRFRQIFDVFLCKLEILFQVAH